MTDRQARPRDIRAEARVAAGEERQEHKDHSRERDFTALRDRRRIVVNALNKLGISITDCELLDLADREKYIGIVRYDGMTWGITVDGWFTFVRWDQGRWQSQEATLAMFHTLAQLGKSLDMIEAGVRP